MLNQREFDVLALTVLVLRICYAEKIYIDVKHQQTHIK